VSVQKESRSSAALFAAPLPPLRTSAYQARKAQIVPPEVPLRATTSYRACARSLFNAPAVKAVWLPPPWQAIATRFLPSRSMVYPLSMAGVPQEGYHRVFSIVS
jgi:hypothetical protein